MIVGRVFISIANRQNRHDGQIALRNFAPGRLVSPLKRLRNHARQKTNLSRTINPIVTSSPLA
jgi:hypothetical protein